MKTSDQTNELFTALAKAQMEIGAAKEDGFNKHLGAGYASIDSLLDACKEPCAKNGLAIVQNVYSEGESYFLETRLAHASGQWMASSMKILLAKQDMQSLGAGVTYAKRYAITSLLGIASEVKEERVQAVAQRSQDFGARREVAGKVIAETKKAIVNHATGEVRETPLPKLTPAVMNASASSSTPGGVSVTKLVENMNREPKSDAPIDLNSWDYMITFGKHQGKTIRDIGLKEAKGYLDFLLTSAGGKKLSPGAEFFKVAVEKCT